MFCIFFLLYNRFCFAAIFFFLRNTLRFILTFCIYACVCVCVWMHMCTHVQLGWLCFTNPSSWWAWPKACHQDCSLRRRWEWRRTWQAWTSCQIWIRKRKNTNRALTSIHHQIQLYSASPFFVTRFCLTWCLKVNRTEWTQQNRLTWDARLCSLCHQGEVYTESHREKHGFKRDSLWKNK